MKKHTGKIIAVVVILLLGGSWLYANQAANKANEGITIEPHIKGNPDAVVTLTEYSDFQCPACGQFFPVVQDILEKNGDKIRFEYKHFPLINIHPNAMPAARAAEAAGQQGKFYEMHDKLFENQTVWSNAASAQSYFNAYAEEIGLDVGLFKKQMGASVIQDAIKASFDEAREKGFTSTPSFELNGQPMQYSTFDEFVEQIETAVNGGTAPEAEGEVPEAAAEPTIKFGI